MTILGKKKYRIVISLLFTVLVVYLFIKIVDFEAFVAVIKTVNISYLIWAVVALSFSYIFRVWRYQIVLKTNKIKALFSINAMHYFFNRVLPARTGEATLPILFNHHLNFSYQKGIGALLLFRLFDLWSIFFLVFISSLFIRNISFDPRIIMLIAGLGMVFISLLWIFMKFWLKLVLKIFLLIKIKAFENVKAKLNKFYEQASIYHTNQGNGFLIKLAISSIMAWSCIYLYYYFIILSFNQNYTYIQVLFASTISNFTFLIPISAFGNLGTFEAGWALGFYFIGMTKSIAVPIGLFANIFGTIITGILALVGYILLKYPKKSTIERN